MARHHTIGHPASWVEAVVVDGLEVTPGYTRAPYQEDVEFTPEEETARDAEEVQAAIAQAESGEKEVILKELHDKLKDDTITSSEMRKMLRMERGFE